MNNEYLEIKIELDNTRLAIGEKAKGQIIITPKKDIALDHFGYQLILEQRGRMSAQQKTVTERLILNDAHLKAKETNVYEIEFEVPEPASLSGTNFQFQWKIETFGEFKLATKKEIRNESLKRLNLLKALSTRDFAKTSQRLTFFQKEPKYTILHIEDKDLGFDNLVLVAGIVIVFSVILFWEKIYIISAIISAVLIFSLLYFLFKKTVVGTPRLTTQNLEDNKFQLNLILEKNPRKIKSIFSYYTIEEAVTDRRGTSSTTHKKILYRSEDKSIKKPKSKNEIVFNFPSSDKPATFLLDDVEIIWTFHFVIKLNFGLEFFYSKKMEVVKR